MSKQKGFIDIIAIIFIGLLFFLFLSVMIYDFKRFSAVSSANTEESLKIACRKYELSTIKHIPQKCFPYIKNLNVKINN